MKHRNITVVSILSAITIAFGYFVLKPPSSRFEEMVRRPKLQSIQILNEEENITMDSSFWMCRFLVSRSELTLLVDQLNLQSIPADNVAFWNERIGGYVDFRVALTTNWIWYELRQKPSKHLFVSPNASEIVEAVLVVDDH